MYKQASTITTEKYYDLSFIEKACRGDMVIRKKMLQTFIQTVPAAVSKIKQAHLEFDFDTMGKTAHSIKPVLAFYAIITLEKEISVIEQFCKNEITSTQLYNCIEKLDKVINLVTEDMNTVLLNH